MIYQNHTQHCMVAVTFFGTLIRMQYAQLKASYRRIPNVTQSILKNYRFWTFLVSMGCVLGLLIEKCIMQKIYRAESLLPTTSDSGFEWILAVNLSSNYLETFTNPTKKSIGTVKNFLNWKNGVPLLIYSILFILMIFSPSILESALDQLW